MINKKATTEMQPINVILPTAATEPLADPDLYRWWFNYKHRMIWINDEITVSTAEIIDMILEWNIEDKDIDPAVRKPIILMFHSPGGDLDIADSLVSIIKLSQTPIWSIAVGLVASAASLIFLACHKKLALPNSYFIFHEGSCSGMSGNFAEVQAALEDYQKTVEKMKRYYIENTKYTEDEVRNNIKTDWYIRTEEALDKGVIDEIITDISQII